MVVHKGPDIARVGQVAVNLQRPAFEGGFPFPLVADPDMNVFRQYRCYDDFEKAALHGTFVIDANGLVRWQDISFEPFMNLDFLIKEAVRLIAFDSNPDTSTSGAGAAE